jgi:hypothetical protein
MVKNHKRGQDSSWIVVSAGGGGELASSLETEPEGAALLI